MSDAEKPALSPLTAALLPTIEGRQLTPAEGREAAAMRDRVRQADLRRALGGDPALRLEA